MNRPVRRTVVVFCSVLALLAPAAAAQAATAADRSAVLSSWTQPTAGSTGSWTAARGNQGAWTDYHFDWSTDYCSSSPDNPLGYDFKLSCAHHDFGYRNYKAAGQFTTNKDRLDSMLYADLKRTCATYSAVLQPPCYSLAWTYYQAVHVFGALSAVPAKEIERARRLQQQASAQR